MSHIRGIPSNITVGLMNTPACWGMELANIHEKSTTVGFLLFNYSFFSIIFKPPFILPPIVKEL